MDFTGLFRSMLARPEAAEQEERTLAALGERLRELDYTEASVQELLAGVDIPHQRQAELPGYLRLCRRAGPVGLLTAFWMFREKLSADRFRELMGGDAASVLVRLELVSQERDRVEPRADLYPCQGSYLFTDQRFGERRSLNHVYELGEDSYILARVTPRRPIERALDLCTGSGVHAVLAAGHAISCRGVDINPRALSFSRLNAAVNGVKSRCRFEKDDLYGPVEEETFGLITANPPFVATPDPSLELYRPGGETGEAITERIVRGLPAHLEPGGTLSLVSSYPIMRDSHVLERVERWLGGSRGWGIAFLHFGSLTPEMFVSIHVSYAYDPAGYSQTMERWLDSYERVGIREVGVGNLFVRRLREDRSGWAQQRSLPLPRVSLASTVGRWLESMEKYLAADWTPDWSGWTPALVEGATLWSAADAGRITHAEDEWGESRLDADETRLARLLDGRATAGELARRWSGELSEEAARARLVDLFRSLARHSVLA